MSQNYHSVLDRRIQPVSEGQDEPGAGLYDYGPDPVREVTFEGELLMMVDWTRGRWDEETDDWSQQYPPLTPVEVLQEMPAGLRDVDEDRLE